MDILRQFQIIPWFKPDWCHPSIGKKMKSLLKQCVNLPKVNLNDNVDDIIQKSGAFPLPFPINSVRLESLKESKPIERLKRNIVSTYPLIHERVLLLLTQFLIYKRENGSSIEKSLYANMNVTEFIDRLLKKRAVSFMTKKDKYKLLTGEAGKNGWEEVGTPQQKPPLELENCLSYDEMKLSAMVYVSGYTECINDGNRYNRGVVNDENIEQEAIIIGLIGPRFVRTEKMDYEDMLITEQQNTLENGYGEDVSHIDKCNQSAKQMWRQIWAEFFEVHSYTHQQLTSYTNITQKPKNKQYLERYVLTPRGIFDNEVYYKRISVIAESALLEAENRGKDVERMVFLNVIGCGLGVWKMSPHQIDVYVLTFAERVRALLKKELLFFVSDVNFSWINPGKPVSDLFSKKSTSRKSISEKRIFLESKRHPKGGINVQIEKREPSSKLTGEHEGKLLVLTYPWDGNAQPGNEFWLGNLKGSGDSAAASCTQIAELHNVFINPNVSSVNTRVVGSNGIQTLSQYCANLLN